MSDLQPLLRDANQYGHCRALDLLMEWEWLVPANDTPLFVPLFGDWVLGRSDGSLWLLSVLDGSYAQLAANAKEYNKLNKSAEWVERLFMAEWQPIAAGYGLIPHSAQCLEWKIHPLLGGELKASNLQLFSMLVYQSLMGQLHSQRKQRAEEQPKKKSWFKQW